MVVTTAGRQEGQKIKRAGALGDAPALLDFWEISGRESFLDFYLQGRASIWQPQDPPDCEHDMDLLAALDHLAQ